MIKKVKLKNGIIISWDDDLYPDLLDMRMVVYKSTVADGTFYDGQTRRTIRERFEYGHCSIWSNSLNSNKIRQYGVVEIEILGTAKTIDELDSLERECIWNDLKKLGYKLDEDIPLDELNKQMLNRELYLDKISNTY